jgi:hypothetical protein
VRCNTADQCVAITIVVGGRTLTCDIAIKSVRKAQTTIAEHGVDRVAAVLQGRLYANDALYNAGFAVQAKAAKP